MRSRKTIHNFLFDEQFDSLPAMLINFGHQCVTDHRYCWHGLSRGNRPIAIWQYSLAGQGELRMGKQRYPVLPGQAMLLMIPEDHCYYLPKQSDGWEFLFATLCGEGVIRLLGQYRRKYGFLLRHTEQSPAVMLLRRMLGEVERLQSPHAASAGAYDFTMALLSECNVPADDQANQLLNTVHRLCLQRMAERITVEELAQSCRLSRWYFSRRIREISGMPPQKFIINIKMRFAAQMLQASNKNIKEIAVECGYNNISYFCKAFRTVYGDSPTVFRNRRA